MHPDLVEADVFAIYSSVAFNHPEIMTEAAIIVYIAETHLTLAISQNNNILIVRNTPVAYNSEENTDSVQQQVVQMLSREVEITWRKLFGTDVGQDTNIYLVTGNTNTTDLKAAIEENLHCRTTIINPYEKVKCLPEHNGYVPIDSIVIAEGLALRALVPEKTTGINFLEADNADIKPKLNLKKELVICAILVCAIAVVSLVGLFVRLSHLEAQYAQVKNCQSPCSVRAEVAIFAKGFRILWLYLRYRTA
jgi:Tfp pilus assembly PilM family ATPase